MDEINKLIHKHTDNNPKEAKAMKNQEEALNTAMNMVKLHYKLYLN